MMSLETRVNGFLIGYTYILNKGQVDIENASNIYDIEHHRMGKKPSVINFKVIHNFEDGFEKLSLIIYERIDEILKNKKN